MKKLLLILITILLLGYKFINVWAYTKQTETLFKYPHGNCTLTQDLVVNCEKIERIIEIIK